MQSQSFGWRVETINVVFSILGSVEPPVSPGLSFADLETAATELREPQVVGQDGAILAPAVGGFKDH